ncbi:protein SSX4-like [Pteronotus mesoamericanus]|uniref:protein SSX4-like n=1 Tax=Pteronotus mesoamericanus TaxID=1884717 RepID=UPI0023EDBC5B|nr:protein SSX4-like [Pteronotus parnellii mesoamericanus]
MKAVHEKPKNIGDLSVSQTFGLVTGETQAVSFQDQTVPRAMNTDSSFAKEAMEAKGKSEEKCKAFMDICKYLSEEEWAKGGNSEKTTHGYMKRDYDTMTHLDEDYQEASNKQQEKHQKVMDKNLAREENDLKPLPVTPDSELAQEQFCPPEKESACDEQSKKSAASGTGDPKVWANELQEKEYILEYEDISDPEEENQLYTEEDSPKRS